MTKVNNILHYLAILLGLRSAVDYDKLGEFLLRKEEDSPQQDDVRPQQMLYLREEPKDESQWANRPIGNVRLCAERGDAKAQFELGVRYAEGDGVPEDYAEAVKWYRKAAEQGNAEAQYNLGFMYAEGHVDGVGYDEAVPWFRKAAEQGYADGQWEIGFMYGEGVGGLTKDKVEAVKWYRKAADQGHVEAQQSLRRMQELQPVSA
jgi:TPR repeat protein